MICIQGTASRIYAWTYRSEVTSVCLTADTTGLQSKSVHLYMPGRQQRILLDAAPFSTDNSRANEAVSESDELRKDADKISIIYQGRIIYVTAIAALWA